MRTWEIQLGHLSNMILENSHVSNCGKELKELENKEVLETFEKEEIKKKKSLRNF